APPPHPPTAISNVATTNITANGATITWSTNNSATSQLVYGTTTAYSSSTPLDSNMVTAHAQTLSGLLPSTTYHYQVQSTDSLGATVSSADASFTTTTPPTCPCTMSPSTTTPTNPNANDSHALELGDHPNFEVD